VVLAEGLEHSLCLESLADRWSVHPDQRVRRITAGTRPSAERLEGMLPTAESRRKLRRATRESRGSQAK
jgi:hypothetical protein